MPVVCGGSRYSSNGRIIRSARRSSRTKTAYLLSAYGGFARIFGGMMTRRDPPMDRLLPDGQCIGSENPGLSLGAAAELEKNY